jgi:hypothetical protein
MTTYPPRPSTQQAAGEQHGHQTHSLDAAKLLRAQVREIHRELDEHLTQWLCAASSAAPRVGSRGLALYVHAATVEDITIHSLLRGVAPVYETNWAGKGPGQYSVANVEPLRAYAQQVFAATDAYLEGLAPDEASQTVDLSRLGQGQPTIAWVVSKFVVLQLAHLCGELQSAVRHPLHSLL